MFNSLGSCLAECPTRAVLHHVSNTGRSTAEHFHKVVTRALCPKCAAIFVPFLKCIVLMTVTAKNPLPFSESIFLSWCRK